MNIPSRKPTIREMVDTLTHGCDGPLTRFVLISRAADQVARGVSADTVSEALYMALVECDFMPPDADQDYTYNTAD